MRRRAIVRGLAGTPLALIALGSAAALAVPPVRHFMSGLWNLPDRLPALADNSDVHYQPGGEAFARAVATLLPEAVSRVEAGHGRPFAHAVTVGVYVTPDAYAGANGVGSDTPVGVTFAGRVNLAPRLFVPSTVPGTTGTQPAQRQRLPAILAHELSHAHIQGWTGLGYLRLPTWFKEGLAVMVSEGGGAEMVSEQEAQAAIDRGEQIAVDDAGSLLGRSGIRLKTAPADTPQARYPVVLAYRQAGMFVTYLRDSDRPAFERMMTAILDGGSFAAAVEAGYHADVRTLWRHFAASGADHR